MYLDTQMKIIYLHTRDVQPCDYCLLLLFFHGTTCQRLCRLRILDSRSWVRVLCVFKTFHCCSFDKGCIRRVPFRLKGCVDCVGRGQTALTCSCTSLRHFVSLSKSPFPVIFTMFTEVIVRSDLRTWVSNFISVAKMFCWAGWFLSHTPNNKQVRYRSFDSHPSDSSTRWFMCNVFVFFSFWEQDCIVTYLSPCIRIYWIIDCVITGLLLLCHY